MSFAVCNASVDVAVVAGADDYATGSKLTPETRIPMGSTTKLFTAVAALRLAENGTISTSRWRRMSTNTSRAAAVRERRRSACRGAWRRRTASRSPTPRARASPRSSRRRSSCLRYLHCHANATAGIPPKATLRELWDAQPAIENVTYRHLLSMRGGIKDYYYDPTQLDLSVEPRHSPGRRPARPRLSACNWRGSDKTVMGSTRDVEPLEFLVHQDHGTASSRPARRASSLRASPARGRRSPAALLDEWFRARRPRPRRRARAQRLGGARPARLGLGRQAPRRRRRRLLRAGHLPDARQGGESVLGPHAGRRRRPLRRDFQPLVPQLVRGGNIGAAPRDVARFTAAVFGPGNRAALARERRRAPSRSTRSPTASPRTASRTASASRRSGRRCPTARWRRSRTWSAGRSGGRSATRGSTTARAVRSPTTSPTWGWASRSR